MSKLETRIDKLENAVGIGTTNILIWIRLLPSSELTGIRVGHNIVKRPNSETEPDFIKRMSAEHRRAGSNAILIIGEHT